VLVLQYNRYGTINLSIISSTYNYIQKVQVLKQYDTFHQKTCAHICLEQGFSYNLLVMQCSWEIPCRHLPLRLSETTWNLSKGNQAWNSKQEAYDHFTNRLVDITAIWLLLQNIKVSSSYIQYCDQNFHFSNPGLEITALTAVNRKYFINTETKMITSFNISLYLRNVKM